jgi:hypothetical protein
VAHHQNSIEESKLGRACAFAFEKSPVLYCVILAIILLIITPFAVIQSIFTKKDDRFEDDYID